MLVNFLKYLVFTAYLIMFSCGETSQSSNTSKSQETSRSQSQETSTSKPQDHVNLDEKLENSVIPKDILIDLLSFFDNQREKNIDKNFSQQQIDDIKSRILRHDLTIESTQKYLKKLKTHNELAAKVETLERMLTKKPDYEKLWLDFYGRVFDSIYVNQLVLNPPLEVQEAMTAIGKSIGSNLKSIYNKSSFINLRDSLDKDVHKLITEVDPRFWFPKVTALNNIKNSASSDNAAMNLIDFLKQDKKNGWEVISTTYMITKLGVLLGKKDKYKNYIPEYFTNATNLYNKIFPIFVEKVRGQRNDPSKFKTKEGGITLKGQPKIIVEPWFIESERPTDDRFPRLGALKNMPLAGKNALLNQLQHGMTWCSGFSGSTNMDMHGWDWVANYITKYHGTKLGIQKDVDKKAAYLGTMMFLVYDGGHSIAEVLWAASAIDTELGLKFSLSESTKIEDFVPNFEKYINIYKNTSLEHRVKDAFDKAFEELIKSFRKYGHTKFHVLMPSFK